MPLEGRRNRHPGKEPRENEYVHEALRVESCLLIVDSRCSHVGRWDGFHHVSSRPLEAPRFKGLDSRVRALVLIFCRPCPIVHVPCTNVG